VRVCQIDRYCSVVLRDRLAIEEGIIYIIYIYYITTQHVKMVARKDEGDWVRRCLVYEIEGA